MKLQEDGIAQTIVHGVQYQIEFKTNEGLCSATFMGSRKDARKHFESMSTLVEPLEIIKIKKV